MGTYCKAGDKAILSYQFSGQPRKIIEFQFAPINVITRSVSTRDTGNYSPVGYRISVINTASYQRSGFIVTDYYVENRGIAVGTYEYRYNFLLHGKKCGSDEYTPLEYMVLDSITIDPNTHCPIPDEAENIIQVTFNNQIIFKDQSKENISFSVGCDGCPEGFCKCPTPEYPGYCCLDCSATAASIQDITNALRFKNGR